jgi:hypothetical protein
LPEVVLPGEFAVFFAGAALPAVVFPGVLRAAAVARFSMAGSAAAVRRSAGLFDAFAITQTSVPEPDVSHRRFARP